MNFLFIKLGHIGDTLLLTPAIRLLRRRHPEARIDVLVRRGTEAVLAGNPDISRVFLSTAPRGPVRVWTRTVGDTVSALVGVVGSRPDYGFDFTASRTARFWLRWAGARCRAVNDGYGHLGAQAAGYEVFSRFQWGRAHQALKDFRLVADVLGVEEEPGPLVMEPLPPPASLVAEIPVLQRRGGYAVIHATSRWAYKQWLPERWAAVADWLVEVAGLPVVFSCGPAAEEHAYVRQVLARARRPHAVTWGRCGLREMAGVIAGARVFCGVDTVAMHIAAAVQTPVVAVFGPSQEWSWRPWLVAHRLAASVCPCKERMVFTCDKTRPYPCIEAVPVGRVQDCVRELLALPLGAGAKPGGAAAV